MKKLHWSQPGATASQVLKRDANVSKTASCFIKQVPDVWLHNLDAVIHVRMLPSIPSGATPTMIQRMLLVARWKYGYDSPGRTVLPRVTFILAIKDLSGLSCHVFQLFILNNLAVSNYSQRLITKYSTSSKAKTNCDKLMKTTKNVRFVRTVGTFEWKLEIIIWHPSCGIKKRKQCLYIYLF